MPGQKPALQRSDQCATVLLRNAAPSRDNDKSLTSTLPILKVPQHLSGHNAPFLLDRDGGCRELQGHGPPLGFFPGQRWTVQSANLNGGEGVFLFSDGVTECFNPHGEEYGETRLAGVLSASRASSAVQLVEAVISEAERFAAGAEQSDDITCLAALMPRG